MTVGGGNFAITAEARGRWLVDLGAAIGAFVANGGAFGRREEAIDLRSVDPLRVVFAYLGLLGDFPASTFCSNSTGVSGPTTLPMVSIYHSLDIVGSERGEIVSQDPP